MIKVFYIYALPLTVFLALVATIVGLVIKPDYSAAFNEEIDAQMDLEDVGKLKRSRKNPPNNDQMILHKHMC